MCIFVLIIRGNCFPPTHSKADEWVSTGIFYEDSKYNKWNIPTWKHLNEDGHTLVRGISPRTNLPFIDIFLEDCVSKIDCLEISQEEINAMD